MSNSENNMERNSSGIAKPIVQNQSKVYDSKILFEQFSEIQICHNGEFYRIKITKNGKLIMNK